MSALLLLPFLAASLSATRLYHEINQAIPDMMTIPETLTSARKSYGTTLTTASRAAAWANVALETELATRGSRRQAAHMAAAKMRKAIDESMRPRLFGRELEERQEGHESYHVFRNGS